MFELVGKEIARGNYMGKEWTHLKLYCIDKSDVNRDDSFVGEKVEIIKVKGDISRFYNMLDVGSLFKCYYDKFGNVCEVSLQG